MIEQRVKDIGKEWFVPESLAVAYVLDKDAAIAGDFRMDANGTTRFAVFTKPEVGQRRLGRIVQRLLEIETYKSMSMLTLPVARHVFNTVAVLDKELLDVTTKMAEGDATSQASLEDLLTISAKIEQMTASDAFGFSAAKAYSSGSSTFRVD